MRVKQQAVEIYILLRKLSFLTKKGWFMQATSSDVSKNLKNVAGMMPDNSSGWRGNVMFLIELRKKILTFRDIIDLPPCDDSSPIHEVLTIY